MTESELHARQLLMSDVELSARQAAEHAATSAHTLQRMEQMMQEHTSNLKWQMNEQRGVLKTISSMCSWTAAVAIGFAGVALYRTFF